MHRTAAVLLAVLALLAAACDEPALPELTTTTTADAPTTVGEVEEESGDDADDSEGEVPDEEPEGEDDDGPIEDYEVVAREAVDRGEVLWLLVPTGNHTPVDLEGLVATVVDEVDAELWEIHVFDDADAIEAARVPPDERTTEQQALVDGHHLVSLVEGTVVRFQGPNEDLGEFVLGS